LPDIYIAPKPKSSKGRSASGRKKESEKETSSFKLLVDSLAQKGVKPGTYPLGAFVALPKKIKFETQEKEEKIVLLLRRHWATNFSWLGLTLLAALFPLFLTHLPLLDFMPIRFRLVSILIWYLMILGFVFDRFLSWFFNVFIITDERVIDVDFFSLVYREISQSKIENIQDVTYRGGGLFRSIFDYGDVLIQTAAEKLTVEFEAVPHPAEVVKVINQLILQEEQEKIEGRVR